MWWDRVTVFRPVLTTGIGIGHYQTRTAERAIEPERVRTEATAERQPVAYRNTTVRHEVSNGATAIEKYADRIRRENADTRRGDDPDAGRAVGDDHGGRA